MQRLKIAHNRVMLLTSTHGEYIVHWKQPTVTRTMEESVLFLNPDTLRLR